MSENALTIIAPSQPLSYTCKGAIPTPESSDGLVIEDSLTYLMEQAEVLGNEHCIGYCANCQKKKPINDMRYPYFKSKFHTAFQKLPISIYSEISSPANGRCPACVIIEALECLRLAFRHSNQKPLDYETFPCYLEPWEHGDTITGIAAILEFNINSPEIKGMPPEDKKKLRDTVLPAQAILKKIKNLNEGKKEVLATDDLWILLGCEKYISELPIPPSFEWTVWGKSGILTNKCANHGEYMSVVLYVAFSCYSALEPHGCRLPEDDILYEALRHLYTAAYYLSDGTAINENMFRDIFRNNVEGSFVNVTRHDCNEPYYGLTPLGKTVARKHIGAPSSFFRSVILEVASAPASQPSEIISPVSVDSHDIIDLDVSVDVAQTDQQNQSLNIERADKTEASAKAAVENNVMKLEANPVFAPVLPNPADTVVAGADQYERGLHKGLELGMMRVPSAIPISPLSSGGDTEDDGKREDIDSNDSSNVRMSPAELADKYGKPLPAVKSKLNRFRERNLSGWIRVDERGPNDPEYLYFESAVKDDIMSITSRKAKE